MPIFPTLSIKPSFPIETEFENSTIRTEFEGGYVHSRPRYTRQRRRWHIIYNALNDNDKTTLINFIATVKGGAEIFSWSHPLTGENINVRFLTLPHFRYIAPGISEVEFILEEV